MQDFFKVYAPAKLNLYLDVLEKRPDGYHNIKTLFEKIDLKDELIIKKKNTKGISIKVEPKTICPGGKKNIVYKGIEALLKEARADIGLDIVIKKKIPVASGLGGGSSDVASALRAVNESFGLGVSFEKLFSIAAETGKDAPFFMLDAPFAIAGGAGEDVEPINIDASFFHVVAVPRISVSTEKMYKRLDNFSLPQRKDNVAALIPALKNQDIPLLANAYYNAFEEVLGEEAQHIEKAKRLLLNSGAKRVFLSGSGGAVFSTFKDKKDVVAILARFPKGQGVDAFLATTYKGGIYGDN